jgi:hypothetical protein
MATGQEMALQAAVNLACRMFGINSAQIQQDIINAIALVVSLDRRFTALEIQQAAILAALSKQEPNDNGEIDDHGNDGGGNTNRGRKIQ